MPRTGRRPGPSRTRERIVAAAKAQFAEKGYDRTTIRAIARSAEVDPALVLHFFGSKDGLFLAVMRLPIDPAELIRELVAPGIDGLGERIVRRFVGVWDSREGRHLIGLVRSIAGNESAATMMREFFVHTIVERVAGPLRMSQPRLRASLVASQLFGLALARYVLKLPPLAQADPDAVARLIGPNVQRYLTADLPPTTLAGRPRAPRGRSVASRRG